MLDLSSNDADTILSEISEVVSNVTTGLITYSIRNTEIEGLKIHQGDFIGICNGRIVVSEQAKFDAVKGLLEAAEASEKDIITIDSYISAINIILPRNKLQ